MVEGAGPFAGSDLLWHLGCAAERRVPGTLRAASLLDVNAQRIEEILRADEETASQADERARLWRDLANGLLRGYSGSASEMLGASQGMLGGEDGLIERLAAFEAYSDPIRKKAFLFAKIAARRGWFEPLDTEAWEVCADNVLMRLALRSGLVGPGTAGEVRSATREAFKAVSVQAGVEPPVLDDLLWELGRADPDLLGTAGGDLQEPPRPPGTFFY